jgi:ribosomal protein L23
MINKKTLDNLIYFQISEKSNRKQIKKFIEPSFQLNKCWMIKL